MSGSARPRFHWLRFRATRHGTEDPKKVRTALQHVTGLDDEAFSARLQVLPLESHHGVAMDWFEVEVTQARFIRTALEHVLAALDRSRLLAELERRLDDERVLYLRFDKQRALAGDLRPTTGDDAVQVRIKIDAHPGTREAALAAWRRQTQREDPSAGDPARAPNVP